jgi:hypothetical protein
MNPYLAKLRALSVAHPAEGFEGFEGGHIKLSFDIENSTDGLPCYPPKPSKHHSDAPHPWAEALARLDPSKPPRGVPPQRWERFIQDCCLFVDRGWAARAAALEWPPLQLFGCDRKRPFARVDNMGLIWFLNGGTILALHREGAVIETRMGARQSYRRGTIDVDRVVFPWELQR